MNAYPDTLGTSTSWRYLLDRPHDINNDSNNSSDLYRTCFEVDTNALYKGRLNSYWNKVAELYREELNCDCLFCFPLALYSHYSSNPDVSSWPNAHLYARSKIQRKKWPTELLREKYLCFCKDVSSQTPHVT